MACYHAKTGAVELYLNHLIDGPGEAAGARDRDWARYTRQTGEFHLKNARAWANAATGTDLASQVDPGFILGPHAFAAP